MRRIRARQVHLDFHTSEHIPEVGAKFDRRQFQEALRLGRVSHVNVFAKCAQGWSYYPTGVGNRHPGLSRDLLGEEIAACHEIDVLAPIYYPLGFSDNDLVAHPDWAVRNRDGTPNTSMGFDPAARPEDPKPAFAWPFVCPTGSYRELVLAQTREICEGYDVDGFWFDVCAGSGPCWCDRCRGLMEKAGLDAEACYVEVWESILRDLHRVVTTRHPEASLFFNGTTSYGHDYTRWMTQLEFEDMPSSSGGYDRLPLRCKYYETRGKPLVGMSGKFHTAWGEFGGYKPAAALRHEVASMLSFGAATSMGDQMHPSGEMDLETYRLLGEAFAYLESVEEYGLGGRMASNLALWVTGSLPHDQGVANMLMECQVDYEAVDGTSDLGRYTTVILPGGRCLDTAAAARVAGYLAAGGTVLALGESALDPAGERLALDVGGVYEGPARYEVDFLELGEVLRPGLVSTPLYCGIAAARVRVTDAEVLAGIREPYFNRTYGHYCSHQHAPPRPEKAPHAGALKMGGLVWLAHGLGRIYLEAGAAMHRGLFLNALELIYRERTLTVSLPSTGRVNLLHQPDHHRYVAHLLYAPPIARGKCLVIDDLPPLTDVPVRLRVQQSVRGARLVPQGTALPMSREGGAVRVVVPRLVSHQAVVFEY